MATSNVTVTRSGTGYTIDVTACNLDTNLSIKDFYILHGGVPYVAMHIDYTKTTSTVLTYTGSSIPSTVVEVRRKTPTSIIQPVNFGSRLSSALWNAELDRVQRRAEEYELNGVGAAFSGVIPTPDDSAFGVGWDGDVTYPATRNALYDKIITLAPLNSPALTGTPTAPTASTPDNSTNIATTAYVKNNLASYAPLASPSFSGTPTSTTASTSENSTRIATTAWTRSYYEEVAEAYALCTYSESVGNATAHDVTTFTLSDSNGGFSVGAGSGLVLPTKGIYLVTINAQFDSTGYTFFYLRLLQRNSADSGWNTLKALHEYSSSATQAFPRITVAHLVNVTTTGSAYKLALQLYQTSGATRTVTGDFCVRRVRKT